MGLFRGHFEVHGGFLMLRNWILALLFICMACEATEARGRNRSRRYRSNSYSMNYTSSRPTIVYSNPGTRNVGSQNFANGYQPFQTVSNNNTSRVMTTNGSSTYGNSMQAWAEQEARLMASRGTCGHVRGAPPGYFVGVGCGTTCVGSGRLVAEAHYQGKMVRVWQR